MDIALINTKHFESREKLDEMLLANSTLTSKVPCQNIDRISFQKALDYFGVKISTNMDFYLKNRNELEADLKRQVSDSDLNNEKTLKRIKKELFYNQMLKLFGDDEKAAAEDNFTTKNDGTLFNKSFILIEFHKYLNGNYTYGSARRGDYYLLFNYVF